MKWQIAAIVLLLAGAGLGQTTRPTSRPAVVTVRLDELNALKAEVEKLRDEVSRLTRENARLKAASAKPIDDKIATAMKEGRLAVGMTLEQADAAMKNSNAGKYATNRLVRESAGQQLYEFKFEDTYLPSGSATRAGQTFKGAILWARFEEGKIIEWGK